MTREEFYTGHPFMYHGPTSSLKLSQHPMRYNHETERVTYQTGHADKLEERWLSVYEYRPKGFRVKHNSMGAIEIAFDECHLIPAKVDLKPDRLLLEHGTKFMFHVEIELSMYQLGYMTECDGFKVPSEEFDEMFKMEASKGYGVVTCNPSFDCGLGASINDILSYGFMAHSMIHKHPDIKTEFQPGDLWFHPAANVIPVFKNIDFDWQEVDMDTPYQLMTIALDKTTGRIVTADEVARQQAEGDQDDDLPF